MQSLSYKMFFALKLRQRCADMRIKGAVLKKAGLQCSEKKSMLDVAFFHTTVWTENDLELVPNDSMVKGESLTL